MTLASIVIIHFKHEALTNELLKCIEAHQATSPAEVIVVDNASPNPFQLSARGNINVVRNEKGQGFGEACETGIQAITPANRDKPVILLNNDLTFKDDLVGKLVQSLKDHPRAGLIGPSIVFPDGRFQLSWGEDLDFLSEMKERKRQAEMHRKSGPLYEARKRESETARQVDWISGAAFIIAREALKAIGGMNHGYFFYFEDCDWCRRIRIAGLEVWYDPRVSVEHLLGASTKSTEKISLEAIQFARSRDLGHLRYYAFFNSWIHFQALKTILIFKAIKNADWSFLSTLITHTRQR